MQKFYCSHKDAQNFIGWYSNASKNKAKCVCLTNLEVMRSRENSEFLVHVIFVLAAHDKCYTRDFYTQRIIDFNSTFIRKLFWRKTHGADVISSKTYSADISIILYSLFYWWKSPTYIIVI